MKQIVCCAFDSALVYDWHFQPELEGFFACLDIWGVFLDYLISKVANARSDKLAEAEATVSRCVKRKASWKRLQKNTHDRVSVTFNKQVVNSVLANKKKAKIM